jgi:hypothetical protein
MMRGPDRAMLASLVITADATFDRGKTWIRDYWTMEVHRISR